jgi:lipid-A-disaccharide synthase
MVIAGEASGDLLAAELVRALRQELLQAEPPPTSDLQPLHGSLGPRFFGAGGPRMAAAGVELAADMTQHAVIGLVEVLQRYRTFARLFDRLLRLAVERQPDAILCVDFSGFNRRFARAIRRYVQRRRGPFFAWDPKIIQYVSPQVWASRPGRAQAMARDFDLLLSIFPFEKAWYAEHAPALKVEFVGHPICDRFKAQSPKPKATSGTPLVALLPGSRAAELERHLPTMLAAARKITAHRAVSFRIVLPDATLAEQARAHLSNAREIELRVGGLAETLAEATLAIASTGTVTLECAYFGVPAVALYKTSWSTYQIARRLIQVKFLAMPNLLANEELYPELIQQAATPENVANAALQLLNDASRRSRIQERLAEVIQSLGGPGAVQRAAQAIVREMAAVHPDTAPKRKERTAAALSRSVP